VKRVAIAGSTGSIGKQTLEVISASKLGDYEVVAIMANASIAEVIAQARTFKPKLVVVSDESARINVAQELVITDPKIEVVGDSALM
jgi:1-deoxy-D-xylulose-5-phosphate reductoisomerase